MHKSTHQAAPTVGQVLKKVMEINPDLSSQELIWLMKESVEKHGGYIEDGFAKQDIIDEAKALELARMSLTRKIAGRA